MNTQDHTWIVVADGGGARVFEERERHGDLHELADWRETHGGEDVSTAHRHAQHATTNSPKAAAEAGFLEDLATHIDVAAGKKAFDKLVIVAPAKALGVLRAALKTEAHERIELTDSHDRTHEDARSLKAHLHKLRMP
ncbi:host attachment protein [Phenylobacterium aquaticum]|uniref:host attachment protein n=1 Tax=Phenylobacterium aquaticum TaxID=1763816 RepID=UPI0026F00F1A|nr:host attachment protein [Phenylobacterium aquaticum]